MDNIELNCLIVHPTIDPFTITDNLSLQPQLFHKAGDQVITPKENAVASKYGYSRWSYKVPILNFADMEKEFGLLVGELYKRKDFIRLLSEEEGRVSVFFNFSNFEPMRFNVDSEILEKLALMKINFGFEVF